VQKTSFLLGGVLERKIGDVVKYNAKSVVPHLDGHEAPIPDTWVKLFEPPLGRVSPPSHDFIYT